MNSPQKQTTTAQRPFAVFDIDGTLIRWQLFHAVTDTLARMGYLDEAGYEKIRQARRIWKMRSHPDSFKTYEGVMIEGFEKIIRKISVKQFESAVDSVIEEYKDQIYIYSKGLIAKLKSQDYVLFAISGSQLELVSRIAAYYGFHDYIGTDYLKRDGYFTGKKNFYAASKKTALQHLINKHAVKISESIAIGDSASDIPMLQMVDQPIAFNPEQQLLNAAQENGWPIVLERKNVVYRLQPSKGGYVLG